MPITNITSRDLGELYFSAHLDGLCLYTPNGAYRLTVAAGEDLMTNFEVNLSLYQAMVNRDGKVPDSSIENAKNLCDNS